MPTYEYECQSCGHKFELSQSMTAKPIKECPKCKKEFAKRLISAGGGFIFKGRGFYATDYKKPEKKSAEGRSASGGKKRESAPKCDKAGEKPGCSSCPAAG